MTQSVLASLAFLKINSDAHHSIFLDNFIPFLAEVLRIQENDIVSVPNMQGSLRNQFGLTIPHHVIKALLYRARKRGFVKLKDKIFSREKEKLTPSVFNSIQQQVQAIYGALIENFISFSRDKYHVIFNENEAEQIILTFISYNQLYIYQTGDVDKVIPDLPTLSLKNKFIIAQFIVQAKEKNPTLLKYLDTVVKGYMIANVLYLPDIHNVEKRFRKTRIFLDTPFLLFALGYSGNEFEAPARELLELLYANNAQLFCFRHTVEEIKGVLDACSERLGKYQKSTFGLSIKHFTSLGYRPSDVMLLISHIEKNIENLRIKIVPTPDYSDHTHVINEPELKDLIVESMDFPHENAIDRDVASISAIYRLRKDEISYGIEETSAIFLTTNETLCRLSNQYYFRFNDQHTSPPCITDFELTTLIWLKTPTRAPDLPIKRIIADSYAAIQPDDKLMVEWINEIDKLKKQEQITEEDYFFMRYSNEAHIALMDSTIGQSAVITEGTVAQIMERAKDMIREEALKAVKDETEKRLVSESQLAQVIKTQKQEERARENKLHDDSRQISHTFISIIKYVIILLLVVLVFISLPIDLLLSKELSLTIQLLPKFITSLLFILLLVIGVYSLYFGVSVSAHLQNLEVILANQIYGILKSISRYFIREK